jgi:REP element-mobilizing transposase RayT
MNGNRDFIFIHAVWAIKDDQSLLPLSIRKVLFTHMQKEAVAKGIQLIIINGTADHVHCLFKMMPLQHVAGIVKQLKEATAYWLNENKLLQHPFEWDEAYAAYSVSPTTIDKATDYIVKQEQYHATRTLAQELEAFDKMNAHV